MLQNFCAWQPAVLLYPYFWSDKQTKRSKYGQVTDHATGQRWELRAYLRGEV